MGGLVGLGAALLPSELKIFIFGIDFLREICYLFERVASVVRYL